MRFPRLFEPGRVNRLELKNRLIMAPMDKNYADPQGRVTQRYADYLAERARGGVGLILMEATYVDPVGRNRVAQLGLHEDYVIPSFRIALDAVHPYGCKLGTQLHFAGRQATSWATWRQPVAPSAVPCPVFPSGDVPRPLTLPEIGEMILKFEAAARRGKEAGLDLIEIHGAHGYLIDQFLSPYSNRRADEYGGSFEKRMRFPLEVVRAVRKAVGADYPLAYRISAAEFIEGGLETEETAIFAKRLEEEGIDLMDVSAGVYEARGWMVQPYSQPPGCLVELAQPIKHSVKIPVTVAGRIADPGLAESILEAGKADFISMGRALHADPQFPSKSKEGDLAAINPCPACLVCADHLGADLPIGCMVNPAAGREREFEVRPTGRAGQVVVVGGGPAGMSAARVLALRGHRVILFESDSQLGGATRLAAMGPYKSEFGGPADYLAEQLRRLHVDVRLGQAATAQSVLAEKPAAVVVATGARPILPFTPGINENPRVAFARELMAGLVPTGHRVMVMGADLEGCETAIMLDARGTEVILVEPTDVAPRGVGSRSGLTLREELNRNPRISIKTNTTVEGVDGDTVRLHHRGGEETIAGVDSIVIAAGYMANTSLADELRRVAPELELLLAGDCASPQGIAEAVLEGALAGMRI